MDAVSQMYGSKAHECVAFIVTNALKKHPPESMLEASTMLKGIRTLFVFCGLTLPVTDFGLRLTDEIDRCERAAELIREGQL